MRQIDYFGEYEARLDQATPGYIKIGGSPKNYRHCIPEGWRPAPPEHIWAAFFDPIGETIHRYGCNDHPTYGRFDREYCLHFYSPYKAAITGDLTKLAEYLKTRFDVALMWHDDLYHPGAITFSVGSRIKTEGWKHV